MADDLENDYFLLRYDDQTFFLNQRGSWLSANLCEFIDNEITGWTFLLVQIN